jgi:Protein of unknown function (DUF3168)
MIEAAIAKLRDAPAVAAIADGRVFPGALPQGQAVPAVVVNEISGAPVYTDDGESALNRSRLQVDAWAATYTDAKLLARTVKAELSGFFGTVGSTTFRFATIDDERDDREGGSNATAYRYRTSVDFIVWHSPT